MHKEHPVFEKPEDENGKIWRYMDFTKFVSMIDRKALFFTKVDRLDDKFEGSLSKIYYPPLSPERKAFLEKAFSKELLEYIKKQNTEFNKALRKWTVVNCWNMSECESAAMWKLYLKSDEGVAVQSTYRKLADSFRDYKENDIWIGVVKYIDYEKEIIPFGNAYYPYVYKRKSFEHEKELRAVISKFPLEAMPSKGLLNQENFSDREVFPDSLEVHIDLEMLVERVYISPTAERWFEELVSSVMKKYGFDKPFTKSSLASDPLF